MSISAIARRPPTRGRPVRHDFGGTLSAPRPARPCGRRQHICGTDGLIGRILAFGAFWYGFIVGDDWRVAVGVALAVTAVVSRVSALPTWWSVVGAVGAPLVASIRRAARRTDANETRSGDDRL